METKLYRETEEVIKREETKKLVDFKWCKSEEVQTVNSFKFLWIHLSAGPVSAVTNCTEENVQHEDHRSITVFFLRTFRAQLVEKVYNGRLLQTLEE